MSSDADAAATIIALFDSLYTASYCSGAASVLFLYDVIITFDQEVAYFWTTERIHGAALLFFANKWVTMIYYVMVIIEHMSFPSDKGCSWFVIAMQAIKVLQEVPGAAFSALRAYVLSRSKLLGSLVFALSLAPVGANLAGYAFQISGKNFLPFGCLATDNVTATSNIRFACFHLIARIGTNSVQGYRNLSVVILSRVPLVAADIILIGITWTKLSTGWVALRDIRQSKRLLLSDILFRGGTIYFVILSLLNVLHLVMSAAAMGRSRSANLFGSYVTVFTAPITAILISRFLLALQETNQMVVRLDPNDPLYSSTNPYDSPPSSISSLGGFINPALSAQLDDDEGVESHVHPEEAEGGFHSDSTQAALSLSSTA